MIDRYGGRVVLVLEGKNTGAVEAMQAILDERPWLKGSVVLASFTESELTAAKAAGYYTALYRTDTATAAATVAGYGHTYVGLANNAVTTTYIGQLDAVGVKVWARPDALWESHHLRDDYYTAGAVGVIADEGLYMTEGNPHRRTTDTFASGTWGHGHRNHPSGSTRGTFFSSRWGFQVGADAGYGCVIGDLSPIANPSDFTLSFTYHQDAIDASITSRWGAVFLSTVDRPYLPGLAADTLHDGYLFLIRQNGVLDLYRLDNGTSTASLATASLAALSAGTSHDFTIDVTGSTITFTRVGVGSCNVSDSTYRPGYVQLAEMSTNGHKCSWSSMSVT